MAAWLAAETVPCASPQNSRDVGLARVGPRLYEMLFRNYSLKQWERDPADMDASVLARIPVRANRDDRYFTDPHQALPRGLWTRPCPAQFPISGPPGPRRAGRFAVRTVHNTRGVWRSTTTFFHMVSTSPFAVYGIRRRKFYI